MPKINVYLPDQLAESVKRADLPVSAICQRALERVVARMTELDESGPKWSMARFQLVTPRAKRVVELAEQQATGRGHTYVGTEHVLLGILDEGGNLAIKALVALEVTPDAVRAAVEEVIAPQGKGGAEHPPLTPRAEQVGQRAVRQALSWGHNYIGCEHLLIGLLEEEEGLAALTLHRLGVNVRNVRQVILEILSGMSTVPMIADPPAEEATDEPTGDDVAATLQQILRRLDAIEERLAG